MIISSVLINDSYLSNKKSNTIDFFAFQTWSDKNLITCKDSKMENYFCLAMTEKSWGYYGHFERYAAFFTVVVLYNYGESLLIKFNLRTCFVFDRIMPTTFIDAITFRYLKVKMNLFFII